MNELDYEFDNHYDEAEIEDQHESLDVCLGVSRYEFDVMLCNNCDWN